MDKRTSLHEYALAEKKCEIVQHRQRGKQNEAANNYDLEKQIAREAFANPQSEHHVSPLPGVR